MSSADPNVVIVTGENPFVRLSVTDSDDYTAMIDAKEGPPKKRGAVSQKTASNFKLRHYRKTPGY